MQGVGLLYSSSNICNNSLVEILVLVQQDILCGTPVVIQMTHASHSVRFTAVLAHHNDQYQV